jgi:diacylglycerol kinase family enzyme
MTIERGGAYGRVAPLPADGVIVRSDRGAAAIVADARARGRAVPTIGLLGGDLCRTLGGTGDEARLRGSEAITLPIDLAEADVDGHVHLFLAHVIARRSWWTGQVWAAMNAEWLGGWDVAPRAHPGDGLLDTLDVSMSLRDRIKARRRLPTGTHVPHPAIAQQRRGHAEVTFDSPVGIWIDGLRVGDTTSLAVRITGEVVDVVV